MNGFSDLFDHHFYFQFIYLTILKPYFYYSQILKFVINLLNAKWLKMAFIILSRSLT